MSSLSVDFKTIKKGKIIFNCPSELHLDVNFQGILHSTIKKPLIENQPEADTKIELIEIVEAKLIYE